MQPKLVVITGPTASGKTALGVMLAQRLGGEVVSADSMQIYRGMDIGTAKPTPEEMQGVPHHMIDIADPTENYSVSRYAAEATACVDDILARGKLPIVVGGTGLYIDSLIAGRTFADQTTADGFADGVAEEIETLGALPGSVCLLQVADNGYTVQRLLYQENSIFAVYDAAEGYRVFRAEDRLHYLTEASHAAA